MLQARQAIHLAALLALLGPVAVDAELVFSTFLGGSGEEYSENGAGIAVDTVGNVYVTGYTRSDSLPIVNALQPLFGGSSDAFVAKLDATGTNLIFCTYLGGSGDENHVTVAGIAVDAEGSVYVAGITTSTNFPIRNALQPVPGGRSDAFIAKVDPSGTKLVYSTYLGGSETDAATGIAVDTDGAAYVVGYTSSADFPVTNAFQSAKAGKQDAFIAKLNPDGSALVFSSYLGGSEDDSGHAIALDAAGISYLLGGTTSSDFPTTPGVVQPGANVGGEFNGDVVVAKISAAGTSLFYATYLGGSQDENAGGIAVNGEGNVVVTGKTESPDFPTFQALQSEKRGVSDAFVTKLGPEGTNLLFSTYLGGKAAENTTFDGAVALDSSGTVYLTGSTESGDFPIVDPFQSDCHACKFPGGDVFVTKLDAGGTTLLYSTFLGGGCFETATALAVGADGNAYITGSTCSGNFPLANPLQPKLQGKTDAFIARISPTATYDLAVVGLKAPKRLVWDGANAVVGKVTVKIQNRSGHAETILDLATLTNLVSLTVESLGACPNPPATLFPPRKPFPLILAPRKILSVSFQVAFSCAGPGGEPYRYLVTVDHSGLDGEADTHPADDNCPRPPLPPGSDVGFNDKGCGGKRPDNTLGADVLTDIVVK